MAPREGARRTARASRRALARRPRRVARGARADRGSAARGARRPSPVPGRSGRGRSHRSPRLGHDDEADPRGPPQPRRRDRAPLVSRDDNGGAGRGTQAAAVRRPCRRAHGAARRSARRVREGSAPPRPGGDRGATGTARRLAPTGRRPPSARGRASSRSARASSTPTAPAAAGARVECGTGGIAAGRRRDAEGRVSFRIDADADSVSFDFVVSAARCATRIVPGAPPREGGVSTWATCGSARAASSRGVWSTRRAPASRERSWPSRPRAPTAARSWTSRPSRRPTPRGASSSARVPAGRPSIDAAPSGSTRRARPWTSGPASSPTAW
jgi:hypothetical protein